MRNQPNTTIIDRSEFELDCVREFSHSGAQLGPTVSREPRRERIRLAILREDKAHLRWRDTAHTYAAVYQHVYQRPLGNLPIEERREPSRPWRSNSPIDERDAFSGESSDEMEIEGEGSEKEDDEVH